MRAQERLYRTADGRLVGEGHRDAAFLAYAKGDDVNAGDEAEIKSRAQSQNKMVSKPEDKAVEKPESRDEGPKAADVRAWAESNGLDVPKRGRLPDEVVEAYLKRGQ